jgi:hypothetical protein
MKKLTQSLGIGATLAAFGLLAQPAEAQGRLSGENLMRALQEGGYVLVMRHAPAAVPTAPAGGGRGGRGGFGGGGGGRGGGGGGGAPGAGAPPGTGAPGGGAPAAAGGPPGAGAPGGAAPANAAPPAPREEELTADSLNMLIGVRHAFWYFKIPVEAIHASPARRTMQHAGEVPFAAITEVPDLAIDGAGSGWLAAHLEEPTSRGETRIVVTHSPNIANDLDISNAAEGETFVVSPGADPAVVGRIGLREWSELAIELEP